MTDRLYDIIPNPHLGFVPSVNVMPETVEGTRTLALEALRVGEIHVLDRLELHILGLLKIQPEPLEGDACEPLSLEHRHGGLVVHWRVFSKDRCPACEGSGELTAWGADRVDYDVECPRCSGSGEAEDADEREVVTDIDGQPLAIAA